MRSSCVPCLIFFVASFANVSGDEKADDRLRPFIKAVEANHKTVSSARGKFEEVHEDRSAKLQEQTTVIERGDTTLEFTTFANLWKNGSFRLEGSDFHVATVRSDNEDKNEITRKGEQWTIFSVSKTGSFSQNYTKEGLPGMMAADPREFPSYSLKKGLVETLKQYKVIDQKTLADPHFGRLTRFKLKQPKVDAVFVWDFSAEHLLPVRRFTHWESKFLMSYSSVTYRKVLDGKAWFPMVFDLRFFDDKVATEDDFDKWRQRSTWKLTDVRVTQDFDRPASN